MSQVEADLASNAAARATDQTKDFGLEDQTMAVGPERDDLERRPTDSILTISLGLSVRLFGPLPPGVDVSSARTLGPLTPGGFVLIDGQIVVWAEAEVYVAPNESVITS